LLFPSRSDKASSFPKSPTGVPRHGPCHRRGLHRQGRQPLRARSSCRASRPHDLVRRADETISPEDLKEDLIHSLQKFTEVDEPEPETVPMIASSVQGSTDDSDVMLDRMTEEELLAGLQGLVPPEPSDDDEG
jgi:hypothetical protein